MNDNNSIRINHGTKQVNSIIEIQAYINRLEISNYNLKKKVKEADEIVKQQQDTNQVNKLILLLEQAHTEIEYYQAMALTKNNGRPGKLSTQDIFEMRKLRNEGMTLKLIAEKHNVSVALVHKVTKDIKKNTLKKV